MLLLIIGVVLIILGAIVYRELGAEALVRVAAALLVIGGVVLAIIGIIDLAGASHTATSSYGTGKVLASYGTGAALL